MRLWHKEDLSDLVQACVILHNMVMQAQRVEHESGTCNLVFSHDPAVQSLRADYMYYSSDETARIVRGTTDTWTQRVAERYHEVNNDLKYYRLKLDLI